MTGKDSDTRVVVHSRGHLPVASQCWQVVLTLNQSLPSSLHVVIIPAETSSRNLEGHVQFLCVSTQSIAGDLVAQRESAFPEGYICSGQDPQPSRNVFNVFLRAPDGRNMDPRVFASGH